VLLIIKRKPHSDDYGFLFILSPKPPVKPVDVGEWSGLSLGLEAGEDVILYYIDRR
jgi:hypothetical protein